MRVSRRVSRRVSWLGLLAFCLWAGASPSQARQDPLPPAVTEALAKAGVPEDAVTGLAIPLNGSATSRNRWERDPDRAVQPGSTIKLLTSIVALDRLGPNLRGRTELVSNAAVEGDVLRGDLVIKGGADADFGTAQLWQMLNELRDSGVRELGGDLILDRSLFQPTRRDKEREAFDEAPDFAYNVIPDALNLNGSLLELEIQSDADKISARTFPRLAGIELRSGMALVDGRCASWRDGWEPPVLTEVGAKLVIELRGRFPRPCKVRSFLQLVDRDRLAEALFRTLWTQLGGQFQGQVREGLAPPDARVLARHLARPWGELLRPLNKQSDNALSRLLYLQLGAARTGDTAGLSTDQLAERAVRSWLAERGIGDAGLVLENGSGLSRLERLTARQLVSALQRALQGSHAADLLMSLPTVGVDGTMRNRLKDSPASGWTRLKTGTLRNVTALAGLVQDENRQPWILVVNINHENAGRARPALDALVDWLVRGKRTN